LKHRTKAASAEMLHPEVASQSGQGASRDTSDHTGGESDNDGKRRFTTTSYQVWLQILCRVNTLPPSPTEGHEF
jgi:hypothetical protein